MKYFSRSEASKTNLNAPPKLFTSQEEFNQEYLTFVCDLPIFSLVKDHLKYLFQFYRKISQNGGLLEVIARSMLPKIYENLSIEFPTIKDETCQNLFIQYKQYLLGFEIHAKLNQNIPSDRFKYIEMVKSIAGKNKMNKILKGGFDGDGELFSNDILILKDFFQAVEMDANSISEERLLCFYKKELAKVIGQKQEKEKQSFQTFQNAEMTLGDYFQYLKYKDIPSQLKKFKHINLLERDVVLMMDSFVPSDEIILDAIYQSIADTRLCYKSKFDFLSYLDEDIPEITVPKFSYSVRGCWIGLKQEHMNLTGVYLNHGPGSIQWYCVCRESNETLNLVFKEIEIDLSKNEGLWSETLEWFVGKNIAVKKVIQEEGDAIVIGPGTFHWRKFQGTSLISSWNMMAKTKIQVKYSNKKYIKMLQMKQEKQIKIPLKSLFMRILNHESLSLPIELSKLLLEIFKGFMMKEQKNLNELIIRFKIGSSKIIYYPLYDNEAICEFCKNDIFIYFLKAEGPCCLECFKSAEKSSIKESHLYFRYQSFYIHQLIQLCLNKERLELKDLCRGQCIGEIENCGMKADEEELIPITQKEVEEEEKKYFKNRKVHEIMVQREKLQGRKTQKQLSLKDYGCQTELKLEQLMFLNIDHRKPEKSEKEEKFVIKLSEIGNEGVHFSEFETNTNSNLNSRSKNKEWEHKNERNYSVQSKNSESYSRGYQRRDSRERYGNDYKDKQDRRKEGFNEQRYNKPESYHGKKSWKNQEGERKSDYNRNNAKNEGRHKKQWRERSHESHESQERKQRKRFNREKDSQALTFQFPKNSKDDRNHKSSRYRQRRY